MEIAGYRTCKCGEKVLEIVAWQTGGVCMECFVAGETVRMAEVEIAVRGGKTLLKLDRRRNHGKSKGRPETRRKVEHARTRAMRRLRHLYPDVFDVLYAEERHKVGLPPVANREEGHLVKAVANYEAARTYDAAILTPSEP